MNGTGEKWFLKADSVVIRDRHYGKAIFTSFKDVIISHARIFTQTGPRADFLGWANSRDFWFLASLVLTRSKGGNEGMSILGARLVIKDLRVYCTDGGKKPRLLLTAKKMTREPIGGRIEFEGPLVIQPDPAELVSTLKNASWISAQRKMYFPRGYLVNGKNPGTRYWAAGGGRENVPQQLIGGRPPSQPTMQGSLAGLFSPSGPQHIGLSQIQKLRKKDPEAFREFILQYLVLNPKVVKTQGVLPMLIMGPSFKLGQFTPGPLLATDSYPNSHQALLPPAACPGRGK
ncbi:MAG: hypothetical protein ACP5SH_13535 [Syntrophobacteraceae bacterium]